MLLKAEVALPLACSLARHLRTQSEKSALSHAEFTLLFHDPLFLMQGAQVVEGRGPGQGRQGRRSGAETSKDRLDTDRAGRKASRSRATSVKSQQ